MRQLFFSILFTSLYLLAMVRPLLPVIDYVIHYEYITNVLCENKDNQEMHCNGSCHLNKQIKKEILSSPLPLNKTILPINLLKDYPISTLDFFEFSTKIFSYNTINQELFSHVSRYNYLHISSIFHPPIYSI